MKNVTYEKRIYEKRFYNKRIMKFATAPVYTRIYRAFQNTVNPIIQDNPENRISLNIYLGFSRLYRVLQKLLQNIVASYYPYFKGNP